MSKLSNGQGRDYEMAYSLALTDVLEFTRMHF